MSVQRLIGVSLTVVMIAGCRSAEVQTVEPRPGTAQPAPVDASLLPVSTVLTAELDHALSTANSRAGDRFTARVTDPIRAQNGAIMIPSGAVLNGMVTVVDPSRHAGDPAYVGVNFESIHFDGRTYPIAAEVVDTEMRTEGERRRTARGAVRGAATGSVLGAVIRGRELENILRGAAIGAGAGTIISLGAGEIDATLPAGTDVTLRTTAPIRLN